MKAYEVKKGDTNGNEQLESTKIRGKILQDTRNGDGVVFVNNVQHTFSLKKHWKSGNPPEVGMVLDVELDVSGELLTLVPVDVAEIESNERRANVSAAWQRKFALIEKAYGVSLSSRNLSVFSSVNRKSLSFWELQSCRFNFLAFLFGPIYYFYKGMWKKGLSIFCVTSCIAIPLIVLLDYLFQNSSDLARGISYGAWAFYGSSANIDYYKKVIFGENKWW